MIHIIIVLVVLGVIWYLLSTLPIPQPFRIVINVIIVLALCVLLLQFAGIGTGTLRI
jgi:hypothetical protein